MVRVPAHKAGDPSSNPGPGENFSLKLTTSVNALKKIMKNLKVTRTITIYIYVLGKFFLQVYNL